MGIGRCLLFYRTQVRSVGCPCHKLTYSLTDSCLVDFTDVTLAFEDANPKLLDVVSVADVVAKKCVDNSFVKILKLKFGTDFEPE